MTIKLILTGGTIDKKYNELTGELDYQDTHIQMLLDQARSRVDLEIDQLMLVDSLDMTEEQRAQIVKACIESDATQIVITHGTDTIVNTAQQLGNAMTDKTIVLVGSMVPYSFGGSDALFNVGAAITAVQILEPGVYVTMNGKIFTWDNVVKNKGLGEFQSIK
jgi:L-asparaginase